MVVTNVWKALHTSAHVKIFSDVAVAVVAWRGRAVEATVIVAVGSLCRRLSAKRAGLGGGGDCINGRGGR